MSDESDLEKEFRKVAKENLPKIREQMKIAKDAINKAVKISKKSGIPFGAIISPIYQNYTPASFREKYGDLLDDEEINGIDLIDEVCGTVPHEYDGWEHSAVC